MDEGRGESISFENVVFLSFSELFYLNENDNKVVVCKRKRKFIVNDMVIQKVVLWRRWRKMENVDKKVVNGVLIVLIGNGGEILKFFGVGQRGFW